MQRAVDLPELPPEIPALADATIIAHPTSGRDCLLATTTDGERIAFAFEIDSDTPGLELVDPQLWLETADRGSSPEHGEHRFDAVEQPRADEWLQAIVGDPVGAEWLAAIKRAHPEEYHRWFAQTDYDEGGEEGAG